jgi:hypothetical protein
MKSFKRKANLQLMEVCFSFQHINKIALLLIPTNQVPHREAVWLLFHPRKALIQLVCQVLIRPSE